MKLTGTDSVLGSEGHEIRCWTILGTLLLCSLTVKTANSVCLAMVMIFKLFPFWYTHFGLHDTNYPPPSYIRLSCITVAFYTRPIVDENNQLNGCVSEQSEDYLQI